MMNEFSRASWAVAYAAALLAVVALDTFWLGYAARDFYQKEMGLLARSQIELAPVALFYLAYPAGLVYLVFKGRPADTEDAAFHGGIVGLLTYGAYDLTNLASINGWSVAWSVLDIAWGTFMSSVAGFVLFWAATVLQDQRREAGAGQPVRLRG